jgi:predicted flap endonuclease-1-like 5' DNA nuclease
MLAQSARRLKMASIKEIEGIGLAYATKLNDAGITTTEQLLAKGAAPQGRAELAAGTGASAKLILEWVNHIDLARIKGIGWEYADLLEAAGVDTVPELAQRNADNLHAKLSEINSAKEIVRRLPTAEQVSAWVEAAKTLPRMVTY